MPAPAPPCCRAVPSPLPIRDRAAALEVVAAAALVPAVHETLAFLLDDGGHGSTILSVTGTVAPDSVLGVVECIGHAGAKVPELTSMVLASIRPDGAIGGDDDADRWLKADAIADRNGLRLVEWFVLGPGGLVCPRELVGEAQRWPR